MENNLSAMRPVDKYILFREKYPVFYYRSFDIEVTEEKIRLTFHFSVPGLVDFAPQWTLPKPENPVCDINGGIFRRLVFSLGLVELISYWKIACPPKVMIECGKIGDEQV